MQDRYLFRGKRIDNGEWMEGYLIIIAKVNYYIATGKLKTETIETAHIIPKIHKVDPETICQCTGLQDKNGKLIWENDILRYEWDGDVRIDVIEYRAPIFTYSGSFRWSLHEDEVIGNRLDNPELLEV